MTKELFVSSTPHETKVGMVEDDQLAEVYLERENEYTLAGSIYKGRVTRVLPGMQSAFVDIGLERDAFLYVSDFMELENQDEDLEEIPAIRAVPDRTAASSVVSEPVAEAESESAVQAPPAALGHPAPDASETASSREERDRGGWRGRRRRGRRDRGPESRFSRPTPIESKPQREQYGPPPGYQPILLPGESISKYRGLTKPVPTEEQAAPSANQARDSIAETFPQDEPLFAEAASINEQLVEKESRPVVHQEPESPKISESQPGVGSADWDREQKRLHDMNVAAVFGGEQPVEDADTAADRGEDLTIAVPERPESSPAAVAAQAMEEEEIDEEEADLSSYVEELEEDAAFDEFEEETHAAEDHAEPAAEHETADREIAASAERGADVVPFSPEPVSQGTVEVAQ